MKCSRCGKDANYFYTQTINGKSATLFLCGDCLHGGVKFEYSGRQPAKAKNVICQQCGTSLGEFLQSGYLGCPECYRAFAEEIANILPQTQVGTRHKGKALKPAAPLSKQQKLEQLKYEMDRASKEQRFDDAKKIYDEIKRQEEG